MAKKTATYDPGDGLLPYRLSVGIVLIDGAGLIFSGKRHDRPGIHDGWQLPQGGIDEGEELHQAVRRELAEEVGAEVRADIIAAYPEPLAYHFSDFSGGQKAFNNKYRGQRQHWFYLRYRGDGMDIDVGRSHDGDPPEFSGYAWRTPAEILRDIVPVKRPIYERIMDYFARNVAAMI